MAKFTADTEGMDTVRAIYRRINALRPDGRESPGVVAVAQLAPKSAATWDPSSFVHRFISQKLTL